MLHVSPKAVAKAQTAVPVKPEETEISSKTAGLRESAVSFQEVEGVSKRKKPSKPRSFKALLKQFHDEEKARVEDNLHTAAGIMSYPYRAGWSEDKTPKLYPHILGLTEFAPDCSHSEANDLDKPERFKVKPLVADWFAKSDDLDLNSFLDEARRARSPSRVKAQDYCKVGSEGAGRVTAKGNDYDQAEQDHFAPRVGTISQTFNRKDGWTAVADNGNDLGFDAKSDLVGSMVEAVKAWAGMTTPPPKTADPTVKAIIQSYLAAGGEVQTFGAYRTTPLKRVKVKKGHTWSTISLPREIRATKNRCGVRPKTGSKQWTNVA